MSPPKTRLDPILKLQAHREEAALEKLAEANQGKTTAEQTLAAAHLKARQDGRHHAAAALWQLADSANVRALADVAAAQRTVNAATEKAAQSRTTYLQTHTRTEALRRVTDTRRSEISMELSRVETRAIEDLGIARFARGRAA